MTKEKAAKKNANGINSWANFKNADKYLQKKEKENFTEKWKIIQDIN